jgi:predicted NAD/FAD-binding protein
MTASRPSIAVVGSGIAGLTVAEGLYRDHDVTVYEAEAWVGGHTHTVDIDEDGQTIAVDTGFIVCNEWTYPNFLALLARYGVSTQNSNMSFSVRDERSGLEYNGTNVNTLFAQRRNAVSPRFLGMIADILRFNRAAPTVLLGPEPGPTLGDWLRDRNYGQRFIDHYILPMGRSIWSAGAEAILNFPARFFVDFFQRHGFLNIDNRPVWQAIPGGSSRYVEAITAGFRERIRVNTPVQRIERTATGVLMYLPHGEAVRHDAVVLATHADTALRLLGDPSSDETELLGAFPFESNDVILHTDERLLPRTPLARAAWNYQIRSDRDTGCSLTYDMNILQSLHCRRRYLVSLNLSDRIDPNTVLGRWNYAHPVYTPAAVAAQARHSLISGVRQTYYAGAYWRYGFHEDGVVSGLRVLEQWRRTLI